MSVAVCEALASKNLSGRAIKSFKALVLTFFDLATRRYHSANLSFPFSLSSAILAKVSISF